MASQSAYSFLAICLFILSGCTTSGEVQSEPLMSPLSALHQAVRFSLQDSVKKRSRNTRTYSSHYHIPGKDLNAMPKKNGPRGQVVIQILGDRRPYTVSVSYPVENYVDGSYQFSHNDKELAQDYLNKILKYLASRPVDRDMIDDFRPY
jgi:hypothetical protein